MVQMLGKKQADKDLDDNEDTAEYGSTTSMLQDPSPYIQIKYRKRVLNKGINNVNNSDSITD